MNAIHFPIKMSKNLKLLIKLQKPSRTSVGTFMPSVGRLCQVWDVYAKCGDVYAKYGDVYAKYGEVFAKCGHHDTCSCCINIDENLPRSRKKIPQSVARWRNHGRPASINGTRWQIQTESEQFFKKATVGKCINYLSLHAIACNQNPWMFVDGLSVFGMMSK
jgi:hypothetical protein